MKKVKTLTLITTAVIAIIISLSFINIKERPVNNHQNVLNDINDQAMTAHIMEDRNQWN